MFCYFTGDFINKINIGIFETPYFKAPDIEN
jgi:hypothetical protein